MQQALEQRLAFFDISLKDLPEFKLDGDFPQIWIDRPWHPQTRKEIYALILVTKRLSFTFPRLVLERIAFWIQLIELCKDFRSGTLYLEVVVDNFFDLRNRPLFGQPWRFRTLQFVSITREESLRWEKERREKILQPENRFLEWDYNYGPTIWELAYFLDKKDRYRIPTDPELRGFLQQLRHLANAPIPSDEQG